MERIFLGKLPSLDPYMQKAAEWGESAWKKVEKVVEKHFNAIAFVFSTFVLLMAAPKALFFGSLFGAGAHYYFQPNYQLSVEERIIPLTHTAFAILGAVGALVSFTPAGALGGVVFKAIPLMTSFAVGSSLYRAFASVFRNRAPSLV